MQRRQTENLVKPLLIVINICENVPNFDVYIIISKLSHLLLSPAFISDNNNSLSFSILHFLYMFSVRTFTSFKLRYYAHFGHYAGWQELSSKQHCSGNLAAAIVGLTIQTTIGVRFCNSITFCKLLPTSIVPKMGVISKFERGESSHRKHV